VTREQFFRGIDTQTLTRERGLHEDPRFLMDGDFQLPPEIRLGARFVFGHDRRPRLATPLPAAGRA
jgi:hypothetical protein